LLFLDALEDQAAKSESAFKTLRTSLEQGSISPTQYAENANTIIVSALQATAEKIKVASSNSAHRMIETAGPRFQELVQDMFVTLWTHYIQPAS